MDRESNDSSFLSLLLARIVWGASAGTVIGIHRNVEV